MDLQATSGNTLASIRKLPAFRLGDVRGLYPADIDEGFAYRFALAFTSRFGIRQTVAVGRDMRDSSPGLHQALIEGFQDMGVNVLDLGLCCTELGYFASIQDGIEAVVIVTASHNLSQYNGFKSVLRNGYAVSYSTGLADVEQKMLSGDLPKPGTKRGSVKDWRLVNNYLDYIGSAFEFSGLSLPNTALNGLNGMAATLASGIVDKFNLPVSWFRKKPGHIPSEGADPAKPQLVAEMRSFMDEGDFELGVAWDGDCDRCMFFTGRGELVPTYFVIGLLANSYLDQRPGGSIVYDSQLCWNTLDIVARQGARAIRSETGHAFFKMHMQKNRAVYGGELSSHHYFGNFYGCDSGMIAWLSVLKMVGLNKCTIDELIEETRSRICIMPEVNLQIENIDEAFAEINRYYRLKCTHFDAFDGQAYEFGESWRFCLRPSKTEPLVRLNIESRDGQNLLLENARNILTVLSPYCASNSHQTSELQIA